MNLDIQYQSSKSLRLLKKPAFPSARIILFPWAGGNASAFRKMLDSQVDGMEDVEFWSVQYPSREDRFHEPAATSIESLAADIADEITLLSDLPLGICGHSMGACVALEVVRLLEFRYRTSLEFFIASGAGAPSSNTEIPLKPTRPSVEQFIEDLKEYRGTPEAIYENPVLLNLAAKTLQQDQALLNHYQPKASPKITTPLHVYYSDDDQTLSSEAIKGWSVFSESPPEYKCFSGDHFYCLNDPETFLDSMISEAMGVLI